MSRRTKMGQLNGAELGSGAQLGCWLGIPTLKYLSDEDVSDLIEFMKFFAAESYADGFRAGRDAMLSYTNDVARLLLAPATTSH